MQTPADRVRLVQEESERFKDYMHALPADAWSCPSACDGWEVQDVVAHLAGGAEFFAAAIARGLEGDTAPLGGRRPAGSANAAQAAAMIAQSARALRQRAGDQLLATFDTANDHLNQVFAGLRPQDWETPCYHPWRIIPARQFVDLRLQELALHEWDIRSRLDPSASLAPAGLPAMMELMATSLTSGFLRWAFRPGDRLPTHIRYRFVVTGVVPTQTDIIVEGETARLEAVQQVPATATMRNYHAIAAQWHDWGITPNKRIAFYCGTGWRASEAFFYASLMGWGMIAVYDGGWGAWVQDSTNPITVGAPRGPLNGRLSSAVASELMLYSPR